MKRILTYGTFDTFHYGHFFLLERASKLGNHLTVAVSTDEFNEIKGKKSRLDFQTRLNIVENLKFVDQVISEENWDQKIQDITRLNIDIFVMGHDWKGNFDNLSKYCEVVYLERTPNVSSTLIKSVLNKDGKK